VQQAERGDGDDNADDGQDRAQLVPQRILEDQAEQIHEKAVNAAAGGSTKLTAMGARRAKPSDARHGTCSIGV